jgi:choline monooxygenase
MFQHDGRLPFVLPTSAYGDAAHHAREIDRVFAGGWHFAATRSDLARHGDFVTLDLFGRPVLLRNHDGVVRAYLNVCAHRHAPLTSKPRGRSEELVCQYHGWRYSADGAPCHVPQAECFRPVEKGRERLRTLPVASLGQLWFVSLSDAAPPLEEWLGPVTTARARDLFSDSMIESGRFRVEHAANWKLVAENVIDCYHVEDVHRFTLARDTCDRGLQHELGDRYTTLVQDEHGRPYRALMHLVRRAPDYRYVHHHSFPNLNFVRTDAMSMVQSIVPTSESTSVSHVRCFMHRGDGALRRLLARSGRPLLRGFIGRILVEDGAISDEVQRAIPWSPHSGVLGSCEERVHAFQTWLSARLESPQVLLERHDDERVRHRSVVDDLR